jgi:2-polyprenyl-3-methyl-5-hydroxy-6-metoxy-1,4-benzoquinol methylase
MSEHWVLDVGCGRGEILAESYSSGAYAIGIDYSQSALDLARLAIEARSGEIGEKTLVCLGNARRLPFVSESFDVVFVLDVIEHLAEDELIMTLRNIVRVLNPDGVCIISTPNLWQTTIGEAIIDTIKRLLRQPLPSRKDDPTHINLKTPVALRRTLSRAGFRRARLHHYTYKKVNYGNSLGGILRQQIYNRWGKMIFSSDLIAVVRR